MACGAEGYAAFVKAAKARLKINSTDSWVSGVRTQALLELDYPTLSVFNKKRLSQPSSPVPAGPNGIVAEWAARRPANAQELIVVEGGAAGDHASIGVAWMMAMKTANVSTRAMYAKAAQQEVEYLMSMKKTSDGAFSTRPASEPLQLWADYIYMAPPFLAYYGAVTNNRTVIKAAYTQCLLYRRHLLDPQTRLWRHVRYGNWQDLSLWSTGNAWAAAGMLRVVATIEASQFKSDFHQLRTDLKVWINEIIDGAFVHFNPSTGLLPNSYSGKTTFDDASASALLAATALRFAQQGYGKNVTRLAIANKIRASVNSRVNAKTGWVTPVVDPFSASKQVTQSPESLAFVMLLAASGIDYDKGGF